MATEKTPERRPDDRSNDRNHQADDERRSRQADVGDAPEQGGEGIQRQDTDMDTDIPTTYEPDKRPSQRNTA